MYNPKPLWDFINERHLIYLKRLCGEAAPWTKDPILQRFKFCNVFRELDAVTIRFREMLREPFHDSKNLWFAYCLARQINWPDTVQEILEKTNFPNRWEPARVYQVMLDRKQRGEKTYTGAYMLRGDIQREGEDNNKPRYTVYGVLDPVFRRVKNPHWGSIEECVKFLEGFSGWGGFLSYEVATDLVYCPKFLDASDRMTWANPGPGAKRGLNRIFDRPLEKAIPRDQAVREMQMLLSKAPKQLGSHVPLKDFDMRATEHCLCETDKYLRAKEAIESGNKRVGLEVYKPAVKGLF